MQKFYRSMDDLKTMDSNEFFRLMPDEFLRDSQAYCRKYGNFDGVRFYNVVMFIHSCRVKLTDGTILEWFEESYYYEPLYKKGSQN